MVLLEAATLKSVNDCYNLSVFKINQDEIDKRLMEVKQRYSLGFCNFLIDLLKEDEN